MASRSRRQKRGGGESSLPKRYQLSQDILQIARRCAVQLGLTAEAADDCAAAFLELVLLDDMEKKLRPPEMREAVGTYHGPWVVEVATNHALSFRQSLARREHRGQEWLDAQADAGASLEALLMRQAARDAIRVGMTHLDDAPRELIVLFYFEGLSIGEISDATGRSRHAVEQGLLRVRRRLRAYLERHGWTAAELGLHLSAAPDRQG